MKNTNVTQNNTDFKISAINIAEHFNKISLMKNVDELCRFDPNQSLNRSVYKNLRQIKQVLYEALPDDGNALMAIPVANFIDKSNEYLKAWNLSKRDKVTPEGIRFLEHNSDALKRYIAEVAIMNFCKGKTEKDLQVLGGKNITDVLKNEELLKQVGKQLKDLEFMKSMESVDKRLERLSRLQIEDYARKESLKTFEVAVCSIALGCAAFVAITVYSLGAPIIASLLAADIAFLSTALPPTLIMGVVDIVNSMDIDDKKKKIMGNTYDTRLSMNNDLSIENTYDTRLSMNNDNNHRSNIINNGQEKPLSTSKMPMENDKNHGSYSINDDMENDLSMNNDKKHGSYSINVTQEKPRVNAKWPKKNDVEESSPRTLSRPAAF